MPDKNGSHHPEIMCREQPYKVTRPVQEPLGAAFIGRIVIGVALLVVLLWLLDTCSVV